MVATASVGAGSGEQKGGPGASKRGFCELESIPSPGAATACEPFFIRIESGCLEDEYPTNLVQNDHRYSTSAGIMEDHTDYLPRQKKTRFEDAACPDGHNPHTRRNSMSSLVSLPSTQSGHKNSFSKFLVMTKLRV